MAPEEPIVVVYATAPDVATAKKIANVLVDKHLAACINILPEMISVYRWEGQVNADDEVVMIIKTRHDLSERVVQEVGTRHPYDVPAIMVLPVSSGNPDFLKWIGQETTPPAIDVS